MRECRKKQHEEAHLVQGGDNDEALLMMQACALAESAGPDQSAEPLQSATQEPTHLVAESATPRSPRVVRRSVQEEPTAPRPPQLVDQLGLTSALGRTAGSLRLTDQSDQTFVVGKLAETL